ncbi:MAG: nucleoside phosphorylase [Saprospiraceae bacterium]
MNPIAPSELVLTDDGSIYHLSLRPEQIAHTVFLVGDPGRVPRVSKYFDRVDFKVQHREFVTHTGELNGRRLSVVSTGIGTDNIDIVVNELDALVNIDFIRLGTSGSLSKDIGVDEIIISAWGIGLDNLLSYYAWHPSEAEERMRQQFTAFAQKLGMALQPYAVCGSEDLLKKLSEGLPSGITLTCPGFYGPQGRNLRLQSIYNPSFFEKVSGFSSEGFSVTNFEMETSAIFGLAKMLGHQALSCNAVLANRVANEFSPDPAAAVEKLIQHILQKMA